ncbi:MAG: sugar phosphate nucleotidyltransferase [Candidatus Hodarchaeaceae archaeon]|nr:sugar phosphate nucleotidyltransferase [Candidatus Hodarchaeaceae archaeon]
MLGMILCGGPGKRFRPLTETTPKALFELKDGYTVTDRQLFQFKSAGFDRVILLTAHLGDKIRKKFGNERWGLKIEYVQEEKPLGTLNAIRLGMETARQDAVVSNGDVVADLNLKRMWEEFKKSGCQASIFITRMRSPYGIIELGGGRIKSFKEKPLLDYFINAGFYCFSKRVLNLLEKFKVGNIENTAFPELAARGQLAYYKEEGNPFWMSIDTAKDLEAVRQEYSNRTDKPWGHEKVLRLDRKRMEKLLYIMAGYRTSLHYHKIRDETLHVLRGVGWVDLEGSKRRRFAKGSRIHIKPNTIHSIIAARNTLLREVSTPHPEDVVRVKDFYEVR